MKVLCRIFWQNDAASYNSSVLRQHMENKQSDHWRNGQAFLRGLSGGAQFPQLLFTLKEFSGTWELSAFGEIQLLCKFIPGRVQGGLWPCHWPGGSADTVAIDLVPFLVIFRGRDDQ